MLVRRCARNRVQGAARMALLQTCCRRLGISVLLLAAALGGVGTVWLPHAHAEGDKAAGDKVVARVNGESIHESEIIRAIPADLMDDGIADLYKVKLDRLIRQTEMRQFLTAQKIVVADNEVEKVITQLRKTPPALGCPCCRYKSLDQFLHGNGYTLAEFRADIRNQVGVDKYVDAQWTVKTTTKQSRDTLVATQRANVGHTYVHAWHIFFNTFQQVDDQSDPVAVKAKAEAKGRQAWQKLQQGETWASVVKTMSEDQISRDKGGDLGLVNRRYSFGKEFAAMLGSLKPGEVSRPFASAYGVHIIKWQPVQDEALLELCRLEFKAHQTGVLYERIDKSAKIVRFDSR